MSAEHKARNERVYVKLSWHKGKPIVRTVLKDLNLDVRLPADTPDRIFAEMNEAEVDEWVKAQITKRSAAVVGGAAS